MAGDPSDPDGPGSTPFSNDVLQGCREVLVSLLLLDSAVPTPHHDVAAQDVLSDSGKESPLALLQLEV